MALSDGSVIEIRTDGDDTNGGGWYDDGGTDYTQQAAAQLSLTDLACVTGGAVVTSATGGFTAEMVGSWLQINAGTHFTIGFYQIATYTSSNQVTLDRDPTDGTNGSAGECKVGGALATPGKVSDVPDNMDGHVWIRAGTYTLTTDVAGAGGPMLLPDDAALWVRGYNGTRGDAVLGSQPVTIDAGAETSVILIEPDSAHAYNQSVLIEHLILDGNSGADNVGFSGQSWRAGVARDCLARDCASVGFQHCMAIQCRAEGCTWGFYRSNNYACVAYNCTDGFRGPRYICTDCIAYGCSDNGFEADDEGQLFVRCTAYNNSSNGFQCYRGDCFVDCVAVENGGYGFTGLNQGATINCYAYDNTSGAQDTTVYAAGTVAALTGDPFIDAANADFRLNNRPGKGAALRAAGLAVYGQDLQPDASAVGHVLEKPALLMPGMWR